MKTLLIPQLIEEGTSQYGMQSFDQSILRNYKDGIITYETAMMNVTNPDDFKLRLRGVENSGESRGWDAFGADGKK
jgi:twitching motility protein PilT